MQERSISVMFLRNERISDSYAGGQLSAHPYRASTNDHWRPFCAVDWIYYLATVGKRVEMNWPLPFSCKKSYQAAVYSTADSPNFAESDSFLCAAGRLSRIFTHCGVTL